MDFADPDYPSSTASEHYTEATKILDQQWEPDDSPDWRMQQVGLAQAHAALALVDTLNDLFGSKVSLESLGLVKSKDRYVPPKIWVDGCRKCNGVRIRTEESAPNVVTGNPECLHDWRSNEDPVPIEMYRLDLETLSVGTSVVCRKCRAKGTKTLVGLDYSTPLVAPRCAVHDWCVAASD